MAGGKRAGARRGPRAKTSLNRPALALAVAITALVVAWGYLVYLAIDFGTTARAGQPGAWGLLVLASLGAVACLFTGLLLVARLLRTLGITTDPDATPRADAHAATGSATESQPTPPRPPGGRRAAR